MVNDHICNCYVISGEYYIHDIYWPVEWQLYRQYLYIELLSNSVRKLNWTTTIKILLLNEHIDLLTP